MTLTIQSPMIVLHPIVFMIILSLIFGRYDDQFVVATFDGAPTADSEIYSKMDKSVRDAHESRVSYV